MCAGGGPYRGLSRQAWADLAAVDGGGCAGQCVDGVQSRLLDRCGGGWDNRHLSVTKPSGPLHLVAGATSPQMYCWQRPPPSRSWLL